MSLLRSKIFHIIILAILAAGVYINSLGGDFVYDDKAMILAYDLVKDIGNVPKAFISPTSVYGNVNYYRPMQTVSYMTDYFLWGEMSAGYHITNVLWHVLVVIAIYLFAGLVFEKRPLGLICGALFAVHPIHTSVVSYIAGRADAMMAVFFLSSIGLYVVSRWKDGGALSYVFSLAAFVGGLASKESAMLVPFFLVIFDRYLVGFTVLKKENAVQRPYAPYFIVLAGYIFFRVMKMSFFVPGAITPPPLANRIMTVPHVLGEYFRLMVLPNDLHIGRAPWVARSLLDPRVLAGGAATVAVIFLAYRTRKICGAVWFGVCWFLICIFPSLNIITPLFYTIAENWMYLPSMGLFMSAGALFVTVYEFAGKIRGRRAIRAGMTGALGVIVILLSGITVIHNRNWKDEIALGRNTLRFNPGEFKIYNNLGVVYLGRGELAKAEESFLKCLEIKPDTGMAYFNLYRVYMAQGKREVAIDSLRKARELDPQRVGILIRKMGIKD